LLHIWHESSSVKAVRFVKKSAIVAEIFNFSKGIVFLIEHPVEKSGYFSCLSPEVYHLQWTYQ